MLRRLFILALSLGTVNATLAQDVDANQLREAVTFPRMNFQFGIGFNSERGFVLQGETVDTAAEIARLEKALCGDADDADRYCQLSYLYKDAKEKAQKLAAKAVKLARQQFKNDPKNGHCALVLAEALSAAEERDEADKLLRLAVQLSPRDPECWLALANRLHGRAFEAYLGMSKNKVDFGNMLGLFMSKKPSAESLARGNKLIREAEACLDRAVSVAPGQPKPYASRAMFLCLNGMLEGMFRVVRGEEKDPAAVMKLMFSKSLLPDLQKVAELSPDDPRAVGVAAFFELMSGMLFDLKDNSQGIFGAAKALPKKTQESLRAAALRLDRLARHEDKHIAAEAGYVRALLELFSGQDTEMMEKLLRQSIAIKPQHDQAWDLLFIVLTERAKELANAAEERLKHKDTPRNRILAAKTHFDAEQFGQAQKHLQTALEKTPDDILCNLSLAALYLKRSDDADTLAKAGKQLDKTETLLAAKSDAELAPEAAVLRSIYIALNGDPDSARRLLETVLKKDKNHRTAAKVLMVLAP